MRRQLMVLAVFMLGIGTMAIRPIQAITSGELDGERHPYVGLMVAQAADGRPLWRCSGTLISSRVFLTAGHCTEAPAAHVEIWFDADVEHGIPANGYPNRGDAGGTPYTHPSYDPRAFYLYDLGVVLLSQRLEMSQYGALPQLNILDKMAAKRGTQDVSFTAVGYGLQESFPDQASFLEHNERVRLVAYPQLLQINTGGTCFGDSGGPNFIDGTNVVGGITSFGINGNCAGTGGVYRVDRADDLDFLYSTFGKYLK